MKYTNDITEFIILGLSQNMKIKHVCFLLFLFCYIAIWMENLLIMISIAFSELNYQPMHFFLNYLALLDLCYTSTVTPKLVTDLLTERSTISYIDCTVQLFAMQFFGGIEISDHPLWSEDGLWPLCVHPQAAALDCHHEQAQTVPRSLLVVLGEFLNSFVQGLLTINVSFCGPYEIDHYFCDVYPWLKLACTDTYGVGILVVASAGMMGLVIFVVVMLSYILILYTIKAYPTESQYKALSTCSSFITVVVLFFVLILFIYIRTNTTFPEGKVFALFYTIIAPMFNPLIYSLRNAEMKNVLRKTWFQKPFLISRQII